MNWFLQHPYWTLSLASLLSNIPLGYIRENTPKFSGTWLFWIHASIPILIYLRINLGTSPWFILPTIVLAVVGQLIGSRWRRSQMTQEQIDVLNQIPPMREAYLVKREACLAARRAFLRDTRYEIRDTNFVTVLLLNMGGPKTLADLKDFQKRLFEDPILIRFPFSFLFQKLFAWLLITFRLKAAAKRYQLIGGGSPIYKSTQNQRDVLRQELIRRGYHLDVQISFNYSPPLPQATIVQLKSQGKKYVLPVSLYPHYSKATTGSNLHYLKKAAKELYPSVQFLPSPSYYLHDGYIQAFVDRIQETMKEGESLDEFYLLFSAHGLPLYFLKEGDPYPFQVAETVAKVLTRLNRTEHWVIAYQSAVGPLQWLKPSTEDMLAALAREGCKKVLVVPISFVGDHIETLCEIDIEYRAFAEKRGIQDFRMSKAIETHPGFIQALADSVTKNSN